MMNKIWYAIYKGEQLLYTGTKDECAAYLNVNPETILFYTYPSYRKRIKKCNNRVYVIRLEDENERWNKTTKVRNIPTRSGNKRT